MSSLSAILQVVVSVSASDTQTWNFPCLSMVMFTAPETSSPMAVFIWATVLVIALLGLAAWVPISCNSRRGWFCNNLSRSSRLTAVTWCISHSNRSFAVYQSPSDLAVAACWALFRCTWNCLGFGIGTFLAQYTRTSIAMLIISIFCSCNWWDSVANCLSTLALADFNIFYSRNAHICFYIRFSSSSHAVRDRSEWFCWLTSRENSHNACTAPITISSQAVSTGVILSSLERSRIVAQFSTSVVIMPGISVPCQERLSIESNASEKHWGPGYDGTDLNWLPNRSLTFLAFRYLNSQYNKSLT